jgi:hypothetical protein
MMLHQKAGREKYETKEKIDGCICRLCQENWHSYNGLMWDVGHGEKFHKI